MHDWIIYEFPELFYGHHNWILKRIRDVSELSQSSNETINVSSISVNNGDLSKFMNKALVWYFVCNLPICFTKNLSSEHGTKIEKLKNALVVSILNKESFCFLLKSFFELII